MSITTVILPVEAHSELSRYSLASMAEYPGRALSVDSAVQDGIAGDLPSSFFSVFNSEPCAKRGESDEAATWAAMFRRLKIVGWGGVGLVAMGMLAVGGYWCCSGVAWGMMRRVRAGGGGAGGVFIL